MTAIRKARLPFHGFPALLLVLSFIALMGCDRREQVAAPPPPAQVAHAGSISGKVIFGATAPVLPKIAVAGDPHCVTAHPNGIDDPSVTVAKDGGLANVVVSLQNIAASDGAARPAAELDQTGCQYLPHVLAVQINQPLLVVNADPSFHNVNFQASANPAANLGEIGGETKSIRFANPETIHVRCDVHPWMTAYVCVFNHPYFAVSAADGSFQIDNIPPGTYTLRAWHERFGELTQQIVVPPDGAARCNLTFAP